MREKDTSDLQSELMSGSSIDAYIKENQQIFTGKSLAELLWGIYEKEDISKAELARRSGVSEVFLHQIFSGRRKPSRDRLLCICTGLDVSLEETQRLLKQAGYGELYPKLKRDAIILYGIAHHIPLNEINDKLFEENEKTLY